MDLLPAAVNNNSDDWPFSKFVWAIPFVRLMVCSRGWFSAVGRHSLFDKSNFDWLTISIVKHPLKNRGSKEAYSFFRRTNTCYVRWINELRPATVVVDLSKMKLLEHSHCSPRNCIAIWLESKRVFRQNIIWINNRQSDGWMHTNRIEEKH